MKFEKLKVCGLTRASDFDALQKMGVDFGGIIFYPPSPRYAVEKLNPTEIIPFKSIQKVGVFVNPSKAEVLKRVKEYQLDYVQLHGEESPAFCKSIENQVKIIKAFRVKTQKDLKKISLYEDYCTYFLFDTATKQYGGSGQHFDWEILKDYKASLPFFLSGGIGLDVLSDLQKIQLPKCIGLDVNSKFEIQPGIKDMNLIKNFICQLPTP